MRVEASGLSRPPQRINYIAEQTRRTCPNNPKARCGYFQWDDELDGGRGPRPSGGPGSGGGGRGSGQPGGESSGKLLYYADRALAHPLRQENASIAGKRVIGQPRAPTASGMAVGDPSRLTGKASRDPSRVHVAAEGEEGEEGKTVSSTSSQSRQRQS